MDLIEKIKMIILQSKSVYDINTNMIKYINTLKEQGIKVKEIDSLIKKSKEIIYIQKDNWIISGLEKGKSIKTIANETGLTIPTINFRISKFKSNGDIKLLKKKKVLLDSSDIEIIDSLKKGYTNALIAKELNVKLGTVISRINKMKNKDSNSEIIDALNFRNSYLEKQVMNCLLEGKTTFEIEEETGIKGSTVASIIRKVKEQGIKIPNVKLIRYLKTNISILEELLNNKTRREIANELGYSYENISIRINQMKRRIINERMGNFKEQNDEIDDKILEMLKKGIKQTDIARELNLSRQRISQRINSMIIRGVILSKNNDSEEELAKSKEILIIELSKYKQMLLDIKNDIAKSNNLKKIYIKTLKDDGQVN